MLAGSISATNLATIPHLPALRLGRAYASLDQAEVKDYRTGEPLARISQVNAGVIRKDLARIAESRAVLKESTCAHWLEACRRAATQFMSAELPGGEGGQTQSPQQYVEALSGTSGLPHVLIRRNMQKIAQVLRSMTMVLNGLTRGLDLDILDRGYGAQAGSRMSFYAVARCLALVMPSNSPGVNSLWLPALPLKIPVVLKPGREEPWTPFRLIQAFISAGFPAEAFGFYPTDHEGADVLLRSCDRALVFGDQRTTAPYANNSAIQVHGPGYSKILIGDDQIQRWPEFIEVMAESIAENGGRSCINVSTVIVPGYAEEIADALAKRLSEIRPRPAADEQAKLCAFANPKLAETIDSTIEQGLLIGGATEVTARYRQGPRKVSFEGGTYLCPTIVRCDAIEHPLANREFLFPYASVVTVPQSEMLAKIGPSLVVTAITQDRDFRRLLLDCACIERLNLGPLSTLQVSWDQPHEGNLFEFLYRRRSLELGGS
jgi:hypothetical protein